MRILYLEPYDGGSHARFTRVLTTRLEADWTVLTLPGRHWKWRMRGAASYWALSHRDVLQRDYDLVFASAYVPLAELVGLVPGLAAVPKLLYFHENQLAYPVRDAHTGERDLHFGLTQMTSALAASRCLFNSRFNRDSFLAEARSLLSRMPDAVPPGWVDQIAANSDVLPVPLELSKEPPGPDLAADDPERAKGPIILWNHRWEHDKGPARFFAALEQLATRGEPFRLAVCGRRYRRAPPIFDEARERLADRIVHWGSIDADDDYRALLSCAQIAVSTAEHEFFGVSMLEATHAGAFPLVPDRLAYPEIYPDGHRYASDDELVELLRRLCRGWSAGERDLRADRRELIEPFEASRVLPLYAARFDELVRG